ncbi:MAG: S-layer homology domain-containing protein [Bacillota bacterium]|nr:S-layer homology domain-containing protein [Bacillota bacterium]
MKKLFAFIIAVSVMMTMATVSYAADVSYTDIQGHWAEKAIVKWSSNGILQGYNGQFRPNDPISRGEMAVILDRVLKYQVTSKNSFSDLENEFSKDAVLKANANGVMKGYPDGKVKPGANITREDAAVMIERAFCLTAPSGYTLKASDAGKINSYAKESVAALESCGYITGRGDGRFEPNVSITRAEIIQILDNMIKGFYTKAGTYSENVSGLVVVNVPDVIFKNMSVGTLVVAPGVGNGDCTIDNGKIVGNAVVLGGGNNSIKFVGNSSVGSSVIVKKVGDSVRIFTDTGVELPTVYVNDGNDGIILSGNFTNVIVQAETKVSISSGTTVGTLTATVAGAAIDNSGKISTAKIEAAVKVTGSGTITTATLTKSASGTTFQNKPASISAPSGTKVTVGDTKYVSDGTSLVTDNSDSGGGGGGDTATSVSSVVLYINNTTERTVSLSGSTATFDLTSDSAQTVISGIKINTNKASTFTVNGKSINTNTKYDMTYFLGLAGIGNTEVSMAQIRALPGGSVTVEGSIAGSDQGLNVVFNTKSASDAYYTYELDSTTLRAKLISGKGGTLISIGLAGGYDPVTHLLANLSDKKGIYTLKVKKDGVELPIGDYTYTELSGMDTKFVINKMTNNNYKSLNTLSDLTGLQITISKAEGPSISLIFE